MTTDARAGKGARDGAVQATRVPVPPVRKGPVDEHWLGQAIAKTWGYYGAHADIYRALLRDRQERQALLADAYKALSLVRSAIVGSDVRRFDSQYVDGVLARLKKVTDG